MIIMQAAIPFPNISPEIFSITLFGIEFALRWYALAYIAGVFIGWRLIAAALRRPALWPADAPPMTATQLESLMTWIVVGIIAGGRFGYVLFYSQGAYLTDPFAILRVWEGGMSFHGGFVGVVLATWLFSWRQGLVVGSVADSLAMVAPVGLLLGRIANFINGELWGRVTDVPWAVVFPGRAAQDCLALSLDCARHPSQLYEAGLEGLLLGALLLWLAFWRGGLKRRWLLSGVFFAGYGAARFLVEFFRQPDAQFVTPDNPLGLAFHIDGWGLTMGQTLTLPMIIVGVAVVWRARRR